MNNFQCTNGKDCCRRDCGCQCCAGGCKEDFRRALCLLCERPLRELVDFDDFAFISDFFLVGTTLQNLETTQGPSDNLNNLNGNFTCGGDGRETITISGPLAYPIPGTPTAHNVISQAALCKLDAIAFEPEGQGAEKTAKFKAISQFFTNLLQPQQDRDCCCDSLLDALTERAATRSVTVTAGPLLVQNATILGQIGDILVLANPTDNRFYFICAGKITFIG